MSDESDKKVDVLLPSQEAHVRSILLHKMPLPKGAQEALAASGIVAIRVAAMTDVQLVTVPLVISFDGEVLKATERLALETIMEYKSGDAVGPKTRFGMKMLSALLKHEPKK